MGSAFNNVKTYSNELFYPDLNEKDQKNIHIYGTKNLKSCLIYPLNPTKEKWDFAMTIVLLTTCVLTPLNIAF
jgi:hypothetical protein